MALGESSGSMFDIYLFVCLYIYLFSKQIFADANVTETTHFSFNDINPFKI